MPPASSAPGQPVPRREDHRFLTGTGRYVGDIAVNDEAVAVFLRSPHAHADIAGIDASDATAMPGVLGIFTGADTAADCLGEVPCVVRVKGPKGERMPRPGRPLLAQGRVRFVGEPVAMVVADSVPTTAARTTRPPVPRRENPDASTARSAASRGRAATPRLP